jgi:hypothetical protein
MSFCNGLRREPQSLALRWISVNGRPAFCMSLPSHKLYSGEYRPMVMCSSRYSSEDEQYLARATTRVHVDVSTEESEVGL